MRPEIPFITFHSRLAYDQRHKIKTDSRTNPTAIRQRGRAIFKFGNGPDSGDGCSTDAGTRSSDGGRAAWIGGAIIGAEGDPGYWLWCWQLRLETAGGTPEFERDAQ